MHDQHAFTKCATRNAELQSLDRDRRGKQRIKKARELKRTRVRKEWGKV